jgi:hypothetical protein
MGQACGFCRKYGWSAGWSKGDAPSGVGESNAQWLGEAAVLSVSSHVTDTSVHLSSAALHPLFEVLLAGAEHRSDGCSQASLIFETVARGANTPVSVPTEASCGGGGDASLHMWMYLFSSGRGSGALRQCSKPASAASSAAALTAAAAAAAARDVAERGTTPSNMGGRCGGSGATMEGIMEEHAVGCKTEGALQMLSRMIRACSASSRWIACSWLCM